MSQKCKHPLLIVDDEPEVLATLRSLFRRDYAVLSATRASEALEILERETVHIVISDQRMPGMGGADFIAQVHERFPDIVRLMITGYTDIESVIDAINRGHVYRYVSKPWDPAELQSMVRQAVEQFELMSDRRRLLAELKEANQLKTAFITIASHELNTPLTIVLGMLKLANFQNTDSAVADFLERAESAAQRLHGLLANTFKFLQQKNFHRSLERTIVSCEQLFDEVRRDVEPYLKMRRHTLDVSCQPLDVTIWASRPHLRDVLNNLVSNAIKFSPDESTIRLSAEQENNEVCLRIADKGVGIKWEDQPHVFEPLFSTWDTMRHSTGNYEFCKRGMGLGLAIVKRFVEMHGGRIDFASQPNRGTEFRIRLPAQGAAPAPSIATADFEI